LADCCWHKAAENNYGEGVKPMEKQNENGNDHKKCWRCKEKGHILRDCPNKDKDQMDAFFVRIALSNEETEMMQWTPLKQHKQNREEEIESLSANAQLQRLLFGSPTREQKQAEEEEEEREQLAACPYCVIAGQQGLPCNQCGVDGRIYNDLVGKTYVIPSTMRTWKKMMRSMKRKLKKLNWDMTLCG